MSFFTNLFTGGATTVIKEVGDVAKKFITTDQDRMAFELEMTKIMTAHTTAMVDSADKYEQQITDRQKNDMASDSWLSKNIRPLMMVYFLSMVSFVGFGFISAEQGFISMLQEFTTYGLMFYFGGRSLEKVASMVTQRWNFGGK